MSFGIVASLLLSLVVAWFVLSPLFEPALPNIDGLGASSNLGPLLDAKERAARALKDLELDFSMSKLSQEDFEQSKRALSAELAAILEQISRTGGAR